MKGKLSRADMYSLETYRKKREQIRRDIIAHKKKRLLSIGPNATLHFEDKKTIWYQIQEMIRVEKITDPKAIEEELAVYNPLIPDKRNLKATFMLEYDNSAERHHRLSEMIGIEETIWIRVDGFNPIYAIANEDLERSNTRTTSAVHFLRFELTENMAERFRQGGTLGAGIEFSAYRHVVQPIPQEISDSLRGDLQACFPA